MNPLWTAALLSIVSPLLALLAAYLVNWGIWTHDDAANYVAAGAAGIVWLVWTWWKNHRTRILLLTGLMMPQGSTENDLKAYLKNGGPTPSTKTPPDTPPGVLETPGATTSRERPTGGYGAGLVLAVLLAGLAGGSGACAAKLPPGVGPAGKVAYQAKNVTDAAATALKGIELFTDQGLIAKPVAVQVITAIRAVGLGGNALADALRVYSESKGANGEIEIRTTIQNIQRLVTDALVLVPDLATRQRIQQITQPILDALAAILIPLDLTPPAPLPDVILADWTALTADADAALTRLAN